MKAIVLAAGQGRRLWPFTADCPKCLLPIGAGSILEHQLANLERAGLREAVLVCGFGAERVRTALAAYQGALAVRLAYNPLYAVADNLVSLWTVRAELDRDIVLLNGDNVFHADILQRLLEAGESCCLMARRKARYDEDDMKLRLEDDRVRAIGKCLPAGIAHAESVGIMRFAGEGVGLLSAALEELVRREGTSTRSCFTESIQFLIDQGHPVCCRQVGELPWADVDTPEDLHFVRQHLPSFAVGALRERARREAGGGA